MLGPLSWCGAWQLSGSCPRPARASHHGPTLGPAQTPEPWRVIPGPASPAWPDIQTCRRGLNMFGIKRGKEEYIYNN